MTGILIDEPNFCLHKVGKNATFELSMLKLPSQFPFYTVRDSGPGNYTYFFNICGTVNRIPCNINPHFANGTCQHIITNATSCNTVPITGNAIAYQYRPANTRGENGQIDSLERCYRVSGNNPIADTTWSFLDANNPARGVIITLTGGDYCGGTINANRQIQIGLKCANDAINVPDKEFAQEYPPSSCVYSLNFTSIHGCPVECGRTNGRLCNEAGVCDYDLSAQRPKCFCFDGFSGHTCENAIASTNPQKVVPPALTNNCYSRHKIVTSNGTISVEYDLSVFDRAQALQPFFKVHDTDESATRHFDYYFNLCSSIPTNKLPPNCTASAIAGPCLNFSQPCTVGTPNVPSYTSGNGFQTTKAGHCYLIGQTFAVNYTLFDPQDPARGVVAEYGMGGVCGNRGKNRKMRVALRCPDTRQAFFVPSKQKIIDETVAENNICEYSVTYETAYACPYQCRKETPQGLTVCSGRGICAADQQAGFVRCLCDDGYVGTYCETKYVAPHVLTPGPIEEKTPTDPGLIVAIVLMSLVVLLCAGGIYYQWKKASDAETKLQNLLGEYTDDDDGMDDGIGNPTNDVQIVGGLDDDDDEDL